MTHPKDFRLSSLIGAIAVIVITSSNSFAQSKEDAPKASKDDKRNFYQVLEDVLADFEFDIKNGQVQGLRDLSIRNIATSENIPPSFKQHLELVLTERILKNSKTRVIQCLPCKSKKATVSGDNVVISSADANPAEMARIAKMSGINHFMDVAYSFQPSGMILSLFITEPETGSIVWSRSYNSETSRAAAFRRGVDYSQTDEARTAEEYQPTVAYRPTLYFMYARDIGKYRGVIVPGFRMVERYDNRRKEVGFELNYYLSSSSLTGGTAGSETSIYSGFNLTLLFVHSWNLIGDVENFNKVRGNVFLAVGGTYASGFLGGVFRGGYEWRLGKHWAVSTNLGFRPSGTAFVGSTEAGSVSGMEFGVGLSAIY